MMQSLPLSLVLVLCAAHRTHAQQLNCTGTGQYSSHCHSGVFRNEISEGCRRCRDEGGASAPSIVCSYWCCTHNCGGFTHLIVSSTTATPTPPPPTPAPTPAPTPSPSSLTPTATPMTSPTTRPSPSPATAPSEPSSPAPTFAVGPGHSPAPSPGSIGATAQPTTLPTATAPPTSSPTLSISAPTSGSPTGSPTGTPSSTAAGVSSSPTAAPTGALPPASSSSSPGSSRGSSMGGSMGNSMGSSPGMGMSTTAPSTVLITIGQSTGSNSDDGGDQMWLMILIAVLLVVAFGLGVAFARRRKAQAAQPTQHTQGVVTNPTYTQEVFNTGGTESRSVYAVPGDPGDPLAGGLYSEPSNRPMSHTHAYAMFRTAENADFSYDVASTNNPPVGYYTPGQVGSAGGGAGVAEHTYDVADMDRTVLPPGYDTPGQLSSGYTYVAKGPHPPSNLPVYDVPDSCGRGVRVNDVYDPNSGC